MLTYFQLLAIGVLCSTQLVAGAVELAPIPAPAGAPCTDTAPDCKDVCSAHSGSDSACNLQTPIGRYLRVNCKSTCGLCGGQTSSSSTSSVTSSQAALPTPSQAASGPSPYTAGILTPSPCSFSCVDIPPPSSPYTCAEQAGFGKCNASFMTTPSPGLPLGYCQITCGRCFGPRATCGIASPLPVSAPPPSRMNSQLATPIPSQAAASNIFPAYTPLFRNGATPLTSRPTPASSVSSLPSAAEPAVNTAFPLFNPSQSIPPPTSSSNGPATPVPSPITTLALPSPYSSGLTTVAGAPSGTPLPEPSTSPSSPDQLSGSSSSAAGDASNAPGTLAVLCFDVPPPGTTFTCAEQRNFGKCDAPFMTESTAEAPSGYCQITCNRCGVAEPPPPSTPSPMGDSMSITNPSTSNSQDILSNQPPPSETTPNPAYAPSNTPVSVMTISGTRIPMAMTPVGSPETSPTEACIDLQSDCGQICKQLNNDCTAPGGIGDYLRANCKQTCNLCDSSSLTPVPATPRSPGSGPTGVNNEAIGRPQTSLPSQGSCTTHTWLSGQWGPCNATCGFGTQVRTVACVQYQTHLGAQALSSSNLCDAAVQPMSMAACVSAPCASDYSTACQLTPTASPVSHRRRLLVQTAPVL